MGIFESKIADPKEVEYFGMKFKCDQKHFETTLREEMELIFFIPYMIIWIQVQFFSIVGWIFEAALWYSLLLKEKWNATVKVVSADSNRIYALYSLFKMNNIEWMICDPVMFKYWIIHFLNFFLPDMDPWAWLAEI